jgi:hypothetical protein
MTMSKQRFYAIHGGAVMLIFFLGFVLGSVL